MARIGILGGTFNPPHLGHLELAQEARRELRLEQVLLMVVAKPPHKSAEGDPGPSHRLRMCELLSADVDGVRACALEIERGGPSYTVDTLESIDARNPDAELTLILGADVARTLPSWHEPLRLLELADLAIAARAGTARQQVLDSLRRLSEQARRPPRVSFLHTPLLAVSSSLVRERVARGEAVAELVGPAVAAYIAEHGLYRSQVEARA